MNNFIIPALKELTDQQVRYTPPARRLEQLARAEGLLSEIEPEKLYPYQFVCYRITEFRPDSYPDLLMRGADVRHDLYLLMAELARSVPAVPVEEFSEPVLTLDEISKQLNVSTKTISRWRESDLIIGRTVLRNGRRQLGFPQSLVNRFLADHPGRVGRASRFTQLSEEEKEDILRRAERMVRVGCGSLTEISRRIARRLGRSPETIRYTIKNFDREHPEQALFPTASGPLDDATKMSIYNSYRRGVSVELLAKRYHRTRTSVYRVINEVRAQRLLSAPIDYIYHPSFDDPALASVILAEMPDAEAYETQRRQMKAPKDVPAELTSLYEYPLLNKDQEQHLFRKMNYLKHQASLLRARMTTPDGEVDMTRVRSHDLDRVEELLNEANEVKERLINANMRLVASIAKRHATYADNLFELLSDGNMSLIRAVEKFDFSRGFKFSTYASWAIMKNFARSIPDEKYHRERYLTGHEEFFEDAADTRSNELECLAKQEQASERIHRLLDSLDPREREIIRMRAGLDNYSEGMTLEEIGQQLGITKERVRQLNVRAMSKMKQLARQQSDLM
ncbi:MAG: sigma-70 family RNA polymerase sigma factor [Gemmataceae bacterium]